MRKLLQEKFKSLHSNELKILMRGKSNEGHAKNFWTAGCPRQIFLGSFMISERDVGRTDHQEFVDKNAKF